MSEKQKYQTIYIRMLEGVETLIPVEAKYVEGDIFEIIHNKDMNLEDDVTSIYEFFPGDRVVCKRENDLIIAETLIKSTFKNRNLHQLIFEIVKSLGNLDQSHIIQYENEIFYLNENTVLTENII